MGSPYVEEVPTKVVETPIEEVIAPEVETEDAIAENEES
jgi:hypothetical protein